jgi:hypothetical protein
MQQKQPTKQAQSKVGNYGLVPQFTGYRAREDQTKVGAGTLIAPSQNVVLNTSGRLALVKGYQLDGSGSSTIDSGILSHFDFTNFKGDVRNLRAGFLTSAGNNGKLQYRYLNGTTVNWVDLKTSLTNVRLSFAEYWDNTALVKNVLWVDGSNNIYAWNGAVTTLASATATTITKQGTTTWAQEGFATSGTRSIVIGGVTATYSGGESTTTLTGVSVDFSASAVGSIVHQLPITTALSSMTGILATFGPTVIGCGQRNQVYVGASNSSLLYISKVNSYTDYSFTTPTRVVEEGAQIPLDAPPTKFISLEVQADAGQTAVSDMAVSEGLNRWAVIRAILSADLTKETLEHVRVKTGDLQAAKSERLCTKMKNNIVFVGNDNVANFFGAMSAQNVAAIVDFSYPIIDDMKSYDFTDGSIYYAQNYVYVMVPKSGIIRVYNMTDQTQQYTSFKRDLEDVTQQPWFWESPITYPISGMYWTPDKGLCGHSYTTSESYQLFTGGSFNGQQIDTNATFAFDDKGDRTQSKGSNEIWIEGHIKQNTTLAATVTGDLNTFATSQTVTVNGSDRAIVAYGGGGHSLGENNLGSQPLGGSQTSSTTLPAWFHVAKTYPQVPSYLEQVSFSTKGIDLDWQLITFGTNAEFTNEGNNAISQ